MERRRLKVGLIPSGVMGSMCAPRVKIDCRPSHLILISEPIHKTAVPVMVAPVPGQWELLKRYW
jgi:hypothetical protein